MSTPEEVSSFLRFLTKDAKLPLAQAISKIKELQGGGLASIDALSKSNVKSLQTIFLDEKQARRVVSAAKRHSSKRGSTDEANARRSLKLQKRNADNRRSPSPFSEKAVMLPDAITDEEAISTTTLYTNRAPLVLAFALMLLKYTMPEQPLSSRLSLAQAVVSVNSRSKAVSLGLASGRSAEEDGWGQGQPVVKVMGRDIRAIKRWHDPLIPDGTDPEPEGDHKDDGSVEAAILQSDAKRPLWGLDLEALRVSNGPRATSSSTIAGGGLPIYTPQSARNYLLRSFASAPALPKDDGKADSPRKRPNVKVVQEKDRNLALLLGALDLLYGSWAGVLGRDELDRRAWQWYVHIRPEVAQGVAGWGAKGQIKLQAILDLRRND
ncbi:MAG: hypothetical protein M1826_002871 [Phylliscum demangeonii]|nr:MAG: hypothetical protein M1826_002871 [Phylliscum demangeonii]